MDGNQDAVTDLEQTARTSSASFVWCRQGIIANQLPTGGMDERAWTHQYANVTDAIKRLDLSHTSSELCHVDILRKALRDAGPGVAVSLWGFEFRRRGPDGEPPMSMECDTPAKSAASPDVHSGVQGVDAKASDAIGGDVGGGDASGDDGCGEGGCRVDSDGVAASVDGDNGGGGADDDADDTAGGRSNDDGDDDDDDDGDWHPLIRRLVNVSDTRRTRSRIGRTSSSIKGSSRK